MNTYLVIENYKPGKTEAIYERFALQGRMLPEGVEYVNSWVEENLRKCYQVMKSERVELLHEWMAHWEDLVDFEVIKVFTTEEVNHQLKQ